MQLESRYRTRPTSRDPVERPGSTATLRGFLPRRMTVMLIAEHTELDRWLDERCPAERRSELAAVGARMSARELAQLAHDTLALQREM